MSNPFLFICQQIAKGEFVPTRIKLDEPFINENGEIQNIWLGNGGNGVAIIRSKAKSIRANHYHSDFHLSVIISGKAHYYERPIGSQEIPEPQIFGPNEAIYTPADVEHVMVFHEETVFVTINGNVRTHENHENNVKRIEFIKPEDVFKE